MASEDGFNGDRDTDVHEGSTSKGQEEPEKSKGDDEKTNIVPFYKLFVFSDSTDILLMMIGTLAAAGNGLSMPLMTVLFGDLINSFGTNQNNGNVVEVVSKVSLRFVYLAIGAGIAAFLQVTCWMITGERQVARIQGLYLKTILRQDVGFFDVETNTRGSCWKNVRRHGSLTRRHGREGWEVLSVDIHVHRRLCYSVCQRMASYLPHVISYPSTCTN